MFNIDSVSWTLSHGFSQMAAVTRLEAHGLSPELFTKSSVRFLDPLACKQYHQGSHKGLVTRTKPPRVATRVQLQNFGHLIHSSRLLPCLQTALMSSSLASASQSDQPTMNLLIKFTLTQKFAI